MARLEAGSPPGVVESNQGDQDTYPYCGDTRRTSTVPTDGGFIRQVENLDTDGDSESSEFVYPEDL